MKAAKESQAKQALRRQFQAGETVYVTEFAETYGLRTQTVMNYCKELNQEKVCSRKGTYFAFDGKANPIAYAVWVPYFIPAKRYNTPPTTELGIRIKESTRFADTECDRYTRLITSRLAY